MERFVEYVGGTGMNGVETRLQVPLAPVLQQEKGCGNQLPREIEKLFLDAILQEGYPLQERQLKQQLPEEANSAASTVSCCLDVEAYVEHFPNVPPPWPVFVAVGSDVVAEFYPAHMRRPE